jgi:dimeric dUTPase (all-alpha-NTP-PPase superfamily)
MIKLVDFYKAQMDLNTFTKKDWRETLNIHKFNRYVRQELAELIDSLNYKHWSDKPNDFDNVKIEAIDVLHFMLSQLYFISRDERHKIFDDQTILNKLNKKEKLSEKDKVNKIILFSEKIMFNTHLIDNIQLKKVLHYTNGNILKDSFHLLFGIFKALGMDLDEVTRVYFTKNLLNKFRQENGYKEGKYNKMWKMDNEKVEDNVVVTKLALEMNADEIKDKLYEKITEYYKKNAK